MPVRRHQKRKPKKKPKFDPFARQKQQADRERIARENLKTVIEQRARAGDILPDLPGPDIPVYGPLGGLIRALPFIPNPLAYALGAYALAENTEQYWGPRLFDYYGEGFPSDLPPPTRGMPRMPTPTAPKKSKRKVTKANKAMKMAYDFYRKKHKGKMTQKKCRELLRKASRMAGKANPHTKSRIGKGGDWIKRHCRKVRKGVWNTSKRSY